MSRLCISARTSGGFNKAPRFGESMRRTPLPVLLVLLMLSASIQGCFGAEDSNLVSAEDLDISPEPLTAGIFQSVHFHAERAMRVMIPYLVIQPDTGFVQNGTILDLGDDQEDEIVILIPPRTDTFAVLIGEPGRQFFPIREGNLSWRSWVDGGMKATRGVEVVGAERDGGYLQLENSSQTGGKATVRLAEIERGVASGVAMEDGGGHSTGIVSGLETCSVHFSSTFFRYCLRRLGSCWLCWVTPPPSSTSQKSSSPTSTLQEHHLGRKSSQVAKHRLKASGKSRGACIKMTFRIWSGGRPPRTAK